MVYVHLQKLQGSILKRKANGCNLKIFKERKEDEPEMEPEASIRTCQSEVQLFLHKISAERTNSHSKIGLLKLEFCKKEIDCKKNGNKN